MTNALADQTSPYLLQHADNPVDWRPWEPATLSEAKAANKPILLSVGYAACHWCHVMAHESFEDPNIAAVMNELFVNIKVDREERPDLDAIYQRALMHMGQQGGWPLTMFLTPDGEPFWGGTYFPSTARYGRPGFAEVLKTIHGYWTDNRDAIDKNVAALRDALAGMGSARAGAGIDLDLIERAALRLAQEFDSVHGGIGSAPKFPNPTILELLWRVHRRCNNAELGQIVTHTLDRMCQGGIYDHLGGGFARYSTDAEWLAPHFEKMLYDNAQLIDLLRWAWCETRNPLFETRLRETAAWVLREMIAPGNDDGQGFAATLDADSEGVEGKYYVWDAAEIAAALGDDADLFAEAYDVTPHGNWEGRTILNRTNQPRAFSEDEEATLAACREKLFAIRETRIRPGWDDKVLADWNGLMIAALANAGATLHEQGWIAAARKAFDFVSGTMQKDGRLYHAWRAGRLNPAPATLDDYAGMIRAALALYEITGAQTYLDAAEDWTAVADAHYRDDSGGGYFFTADDAEALIVRAKSAEDNATPAGNSVMAQNLARLWLLTGETRYRETADETIAAFSGEVERNFFPLSALMNAAELVQCARQVAIVGDRGTDATGALMDSVFLNDDPNRVLAVVAPGEAIAETHPAAGKGQQDGAPTAYVCIGTTCSLPLTRPQALSDAMA